MKTKPKKRKAWYLRDMTAKELIEQAKSERLKRSDSRKQTPRWVTNEELQEIM